jgi:hypothetical protein
MSCLLDRLLCCSGIAELPRPDTSALLLKAAVVDGEGIAIRPAAGRVAEPRPSRICQETAIALGQLHLQETRSEV